MINYILEVSFCWTIFYLAYYLLFGTETFFQANRWYLLSTLLLGLLLPIDYFSIADFWAEEEVVLGEYLESITVGLTSVEEVVDITITASSLESGLDLWTILLWIYWLGVAFFGFRFLVGIAQIVKEYRHATIEAKDNYFLVRTRTVHLPFSFFSFLFWSEYVNYDETDKAKILDHELAHIRQGHSFDVIFLELLSIFLWCSPLIHLYNNELRNIHEYLADAAVLATTKTKQYGQLLLRQSQSGMQLAVANNFIHSQLKKRIKMMTKNKSPKLAYLKYSLSIPILVLVMSVMAQKISIAQTLTKVKTSTVAEAATELNGDPVYKVVYDMPRFPGCEDKASLEEKKKCARENLLKYIYTNIKYPKAARQAGIGGTCVVRFVIDEEGKVVKPELVRTLGGGLGEECLRVVSSMNNLAERWTPGKLENGEAVKVYFNLPIKFKLEEGNTLTKVKTKEKEKEKDVFMVVDQMPRFPGCEDLPEGKEKQSCSTQKMLEFVYKNVKYPKGALDQGIEGVNVVRFIIDMEGNVIKPELIRDIGGGTGEEALRVVKLMQTMPEKWIPGRQAGEAVKVYFNLPLKFKLSGEIKKTDKNKLVAPPPPPKVEDIASMPRFPGSEHLTDVKARDKAAKKQLLQFVYGNLVYPKAASAAGTEGTVVVKFIVDATGMIKEPQIVRSIGEDCDKAVLDMVAKMPKWIPGQKDGKAVGIAYNLPVKFKLAKAENDLDEINVVGLAPSAATKKMTLALEGFKAFPNPSRGNITLSFKGAVAPTTVKIVDASGKTVFEDVQTNFDGMYQRTIDLTKAARGNYSIIVNQANKTFAKSIVLQ